MNKRQVLDIVFIIFGFYILMSFLTYLPFLIFMQGNSLISISRKVPYILMMGLYVLIFLALSVIFLFKREKLINMLIGKSEQHEPQQSETLPCYARLAFWIQIIGLYYLISSGTKAIGQLAIIVSINMQPISARIWWTQTAPQIVAAIVAVLLIWKSEPIANFINNITKQPQSKNKEV